MRNSRKTLNIIFNPSILEFDITKRKTFKEKLADKKIYFDTIAATSIAMMGIVLTIVGINVNNRTNTLAEEQLLISKLANMPMFNLSGESGQTYFDENMNEKGIKIVIKNNGGQITEASVYAESYLEFEIWDKSVKEGYIKAKAKIYNTYDMARGSYMGCCL